MTPKEEEFIVLVRYEAARDNKVVSFTPLVVLRLIDIIDRQDERWNDFQCKLLASSTTKPVGDPNSYMRGWHDCLNDVRKWMQRLERIREGSK